MRETLCFLIGAAVGSAVTYYIVKEKYRKVAQDEIDAMKKHYNKESEKDKDFEERIEEEEGIIYYDDLVKDLYTPKDTGGKKPYAITEKEFEETKLDYEKSVITYFDEDGVLSEEEDVFDDIDYTIGLDNLYLFNDTDVIFVRNDHSGTDYKVVCEHLAYEDRYPQSYDEDE